MDAQKVREALNVPKDQRIGQWIYNQCRDKEICGQNCKEHGVDIFGITDEDFLNHIENAS